MRRWSNAKFLTTQSQLLSSHTERDTCDAQIQSIRPCRQRNIPVFGDKGESHKCTCICPQKMMYKAKKIPTVILFKPRPAHGILVLKTGTLNSQLEEYKTKQ